MEQSVVSVFDKKTGLYGNPFIVRHVGEAIREWDVVRKNPETKYGKNPEDFDLMEIGSYDDSKGHFTNLQSPRTLQSGV